MTASSLTLTLTPEQRAGRFTLTWDAESYSLEFRPEIDVTLRDLLRRLHIVLVGGQDPSKKLAAHELLSAVGTRLWTALFPSAIATETQKALEHELRTGTTPLFLMLPSQLAALPWELLYDPLQFDDLGFLVRRRPFARLFPGGIELPPLVPPLRVLLLISSPPGLREEEHLDVESEWSSVEKAIRESRETGLLHLHVEDIVTPQRVRQALVRFEPHILHYIGHGGFDAGAGGYLVWEDEHGDPIQMFATHLADLLRARELSAILLHGCQTARSDARADFGSVAGALLGAGIPAVLAQQAGFTYESSQRASEMFYTALTNGAGLAEATFEMRLALTQAEQPDWAVPILQATIEGLSLLLDTTAPSHISDPTLIHNRVSYNLPAPTGIFVGRQRELRALRTMLESAPATSPVMALITGPGGIGKSTLVSQAVMRYGEGYRATLTLPCTGYQGVELILKQIGEFLQRHGASRFLSEILPDPKLNTTAKIKGVIEELNLAGPFLLVVDNLETVQREDHSLKDPDFLQLLQHLLTNLVNGRVLITGRYAVQNFLPRGKFATNLLQLHLDDLGNYEIKQLFERHPTLARLGNTLRDELVREFGGMPYVYDLLSSKAASQDLTALIQDVQGRITWQHQQRAANEWQQVRHQVIEFAALEAAVASLPEQAQTLLARLSVFRRSFPLKALEVGLGAINSDWQLLLDWGLLRFSPAGSYYQLHSLTTRYAERLLDAERLKATQLQVAEWYLHYANDESHNIADYLDAHHFFSIAGEAQQAGELAMDLAPVLSRFGLYDLLRDLCEATIRDAPNSHLVASAQNQLGMLAQDVGKYEEARRLYNASLALLTELGDHNGYANILLNIGIIALIQGEFEEARTYFLKSLDLSKQLGDQGLRAKILHELGIIAFSQGGYGEAQRLYKESLAIFEQLGDKEAPAAILGHLGMIEFEQGQYEEAKRYYNESLEAKRRLQDLRGQAGTLHELGSIALTQGNHEEAQRYFNESLDIKERLGNQAGRAITLGALGMIAKDQGQYEEAKRYYSESLDIQKRVGDPDGCATMFRELGDIAEKEGEYEEAQHLLSEAMAIFDRLGNQLGRAHVLNSLGVNARRQKQYEEARRYYDEAMAIFEQLGNQNGRAGILGELGSIAASQKRFEEAEHFYGLSIAIYRQLGDQIGQASTLKDCGTISSLQGKYEEALRYYDEALTLFDRLGKRDSCASIQQALGDIALAQKRYLEAEHHYSESLVVFMQLSDDEGQAYTLRSLGDTATKQDSYEQAQHYYTEALAIFKHIGREGDEAVMIGRLGNTAARLERYDEAFPYFHEAAMIFKRLDDKEALADIWHSLGNVASTQGQYEEAKHYYADALAVFQNFGKQERHASTLRSLGDIAWKQKQYEEAQRYYNEAFLLSKELNDGEGQADMLYQLGNIAVEQGDFEEAQRHYNDAMAIFEQLDDQEACADILHSLGNITFAWQQFEVAQQYYHKALVIFQQLVDRERQASILHQLGNIAQEQEEYEEARHFYNEAMTLYEQIGDERGQASIFDMLGMIALERGEYQEAQDLYSEVLSFCQHHNEQSGYASALHQLGIIAQNQGKYEEAGSLYRESLAIKELLGNQEGCANTLGRLGLLARQQGDYPSALRYTAQAFARYDRLHSSKRRFALRTIAELRAEIGEDAFAEIWHEVSGEQPLPDLSVLERRKTLLQRLINFMQAPNLDESKRLLEADRDLLSEGPTLC